MPRAQLVDGGGDSPTSPYDYHDLSLKQLQDVLGLRSTAIKGVQADWQQFAANLNGLITDPGLSLEKAMSYLKDWQSQASGPFLKRAQDIHDFGQQIVQAAYQAGESFADPAQSFHTSTWLLGISIDDMNSLFNLAENARQEWSQALWVLVNFLSQQQTGTPGYHDSTSSIGNFPGYATWQGVPNRPEINFQYLYGSGQNGSYPGVVQFAGQVRPNYSRVDITAQAGSYGPTTLTNVIVGIDWGNDAWAADNFPDTHRDQLAILLNQVAGSSYTPLVGQFPQVPQPSWLGNSQGSSGPPPGGPPPGGPPPGGPPPGGPSGGGYGGGYAGSGVGGNGFGGQNGTAGSPVPPGSAGGGVHGGSGTGAGTIAGGGPWSYPGGGHGGSGTGTIAGGGPWSYRGGGHGGSGTGTIAGGGPGSGGVAPTHLAGYTAPAAGSGAGGLGGGTAGLGAGGTGNTLGASGSSGLTSGSGLGASSATGGAAGSGLAGAAGRSGMPMMPPMMPPMAGNQDKDRQRKSWLPEDEDIWGTDADVVPPVISGDS